MDNAGYNWAINNLEDYKCLFQNTDMCTILSHIHTFLAIEYILILLLLIFSWIVMPQYLSVHNICIHYMRCVQKVVNINL